MVSEKSAGPWCGPTPYFATAFFGGGASEGYIFPGLQHLGLMLVTHWNHGKHKKAINMAYCECLVTFLEQNGKSRHLSLRRANRGPDKWEQGTVVFFFVVFFSGFEPHPI